MSEHIVVMRTDSIGTIHQRAFPNYDEAKKFFDEVRKDWFFCRLCKVLESNASIFDPEEEE